MADVLLFQAALECKIVCIKGDAGFLELVPQCKVGKWAE